MNPNCMPTKDSIGDSADDGRFWMVWNVNGRAPTVAHPSEEAANNEAIRLARVAPGQEFVVLQALHAYRITAPAPPPVERIPLTEVDHLPF